MWDRSFQSYALQVSDHPKCEELVIPYDSQTAAGLLVLIFYEEESGHIYFFWENV